MTNLTRRLLAAFLMLLLLFSFSSCSCSKSDRKQTTGAPADTTVPSRPSETLPTETRNQPTEPAATETRDQSTEPPTTEEPTVPEEVRLFDLEIYSKGDSGHPTLSHSKKHKDSKGYQHEDCYILLAGKGSNRYVRYELGGRYSTLTGSFFASANDGSQLWVEFYNGDTLLFITPKLNKETARVDFTLDVSGVEYLTVRPRKGYFCSDQLNEWIVTDQFILKTGDGSGAPPEEAYVPESIDLFELNPYSTDGDIVGTANYRASVKDSAGFVHNSSYVLYADKNARRYVRWDLDGKYNTVSGSLYVYPGNTGTIWLDFYDGETYLFSTEKLSKKQKSVSFSYDITGVKYLTIYPMLDKNSSNQENWLISEPIIIGH